MLLEDSPTETNEKREPELLGYVLGEVMLEIFRRRLEIAEREMKREERGEH